MRLLSTIGLWGLIAGCNAPDPVAAYLEAAQNPVDPDACLAIPEGSLQSECLAMTAAEVAQQTGQPEPARGRCERIPAGDAWRGECFFLLVDTLTLTGEPARELCQQAGDYSDFCLGHALQREVRPRLEAMPRGGEADAFDYVRDQARFYYPDARTAAQKVWQVMGEHLASRDLGQTFTAASCGGIPEPLCRSVFLTWMRFTLRDTGRSEGAMVAACPLLPLDAAEAASLGLPPWTEDADPVARAALRQFCGRHQGRRSPLPP